ncbi:hypothetical protein [Methanolobus vulcani]|uniref:Uncharacterized protein n=1 Tax=Methanolobus vulcani TaxID=38026 RepID=A0A7Z8KNV2_9EURY|nr:hypothetical protein [Methanolobus vulcani]TQD26114.1 hypothetical protein FKV42_04955 [Methanolobus vulcani]
MVNLDKIELILYSVLFFVSIIYFIHLKTKTKEVEYNPNPNPNEIFQKELCKEYKKNPDDRFFLKYSLIILLAAVICFAAGFLIDFIYFILGMILFVVSALLGILSGMINYSKSNTRTKNALKTTAERTNDKQATKFTNNYDRMALGVFISILVFTYIGVKILKIIN